MLIKLGENAYYNSFETKRELNKSILQFIEQGKIHRVVFKGDPYYIHHTLMKRLISKDNSLLISNDYKGAFRQILKMTNYYPYCIVYKDKDLDDVEYEEIEIADNWTIDNNNKLISMYNGGMKGKDIAEKFNRSSNAIKKQIFRLKKIPEYKNKFLPVIIKDNTEVIEMYNEGMKQKDIAAKLNCSWNSVRKIIYRLRKENLIK